MAGITSDYQLVPDQLHVLQQGNPQCPRVNPVEDAVINYASPVLVHGIGVNKCIDFPAGLPKPDRQEVRLDPWPDRPDHDHSM